MNTRILFSGVAIVFAIFPSAWGEEDSQVTRAWKDASRLLINEAHRAFEESSSRENRFGEAVTLLNLQPKTEANIERAARIFSEIAKVNPVDDFTVSAKYYLARIEQIHRSQPNPVKAEEFFTLLIRDHAAHPVAQQAHVKLAMLQLFADVPPQEREKRYHYFEQATALLTDTLARRDLHLLLADCAMYLFDSREKSLEHLLAADQIGIHRNRQQATVWVRIAELARLTSQPKVAAEFYQRFAEKYPRDHRNFAVRQRWSEMKEALP